MTSNRPYLIRALYEWITDNGLTPFLLVNAETPGTLVPKEHVRNGQIVLNVSPSAVHALQLGNDWIECSARFGGVARALQIPVPAVLAIYARENGYSMVFSPEPDWDESADSASPEPSDSPELPEPPEPPQPSGRPKRKPTLKIVK